MRRLPVVILMTGAILLAGCGVVEQRKNAALREVGRAALSSVLKIASRGGSSTDASQPSSAPLVIAESESLVEARETPKVAKVAAPKEEVFTFTFDSESIDAAPLVKRIASARNEGNRRRSQLLIEAKKLKIERARIDEALHHASMAVSAAAPAITAHTDELEVVEIHVAERLSEDELRRFVSAIPAPPAPAPVPSERCSSQARTAS